jgi:type II secretory pathway pseudopilin PulG
MFDLFGGQRIALDVPANGEEMPVLLDGKTFESSLIQMAVSDRMMGDAPSHGMGMGQPAEKGGDLAVVMGPDYEMPMRGHDAETEDGNRMTVVSFKQDSLKSLEIAFVAEHDHLSDGTVEDVVDEASGSRAWMTSHAAKDNRPDRPTSKLAASPFISRGRGAFTYIELLAMLAVAAILVAIFVPYSASLQEKDRRLRCEENLRELRDALQQYARDADMGLTLPNYPRVAYDPKTNRNGYTAFTGSDAANPFAAPVKPNDVTASLWLLVRGGYVKDLSVFVCPSSGGVPDRLTDARGRQVSADKRSNFRAAKNLSYSYASPFSGYAGYSLNSDLLPGQFALMADLNPGRVAASVPYNASPLELTRANSRNHGQAGQNVLYADGSVSFETTPYCGFRPADATDGDNIYTALAQEPLVRISPFYAGNGFVGQRYGPSYEWDSYLVPTADDARAQSRQP